MILSDTRWRHVAMQTPCVAGLCQVSHPFGLVLIKVTENKYLASRNYCRFLGDFNNNAEVVLTKNVILKNVRTFQFWIETNVLVLCSMLTVNVFVVRLFS